MLKSLAKKPNSSSAKIDNIQSNPMAKKGSGSMCKMIKIAFDDNLVEKALKEFPKFTSSAEYEDTVKLTGLKTNSFKDLRYINCTPKSNEEMSDFVSDASTKESSTSC